MERHGDRAGTVSFEDGQRTGYFTKLDRADAERAAGRPAAKVRHPLRFPAHEGWKGHPSAVGRCTAYESYTGGKTSQSPDYPQEIKSVVNPTVKVTNEDETESQTVTLPYTLNAIPVSRGGNVTIGEQQYISDYLDIEKGKLYRKTKRLNLKDVDAINIAHGFHK